MNYDDKINQLYDIIGGLGTQMVKYIQEEKIIENKTEKENTYKVNEVQAENINKFIDSLKWHINEFNYYTEFYPNKEKVWEFQIKNVTTLTNYIDEMRLEG